MKEGDVVNGEGVVGESVGEGADEGDCVVGLLDGAGDGDDELDEGGAVIGEERELGGIEGGDELGEEGKEEGEVGAGGFEAREEDHEVRRGVERGIEEEEGVLLRGGERGEGRRGLLLQQREQTRRQRGERRRAAHCRQ